MQTKTGLAWYASSDFVRRGFCRKCGASLFWQRTGSGKISVAAGSLESPTELVADRHIFAGDAGDYYTINDGLPVYSQND